jgi:hypothetical protein
MFLSPKAGQTLFAKYITFVIILKPAIRGWLLFVYY